MPLFMIGTRRSGTNLLRLMLNQLPAIAAPHPPHILERLAPLEHLYNNLNDEANFEQLIEDACLLVESNPVKWEAVRLDRDEVKSLCKEHSLVAIYSAIYDIMAKCWGAEDWACKSVSNVYFLPEIERYFGKTAKFIYLYRDGRDVALSFQKALIGDKTFYHLAKVWDAEQRLALACQERLGDAQFFAVSYEELTTEPETALRRICHFLGAEYSSEMLNFHSSKEASRTAVTKLWSRVTKPVDANNSNKFLKESSQEEISIYETIAGASLDALGYKRHFVELGQEVEINKEQLAALELKNNELKKIALQRTDPKDLELRKPQAELMESIISRNIL